MAGTTTKSRDNAGHVGGAIRDLLLEHNKLITDLGTNAAAQVATGVVTATALSIGTTVTLACSASVIQINGVRTLVAALTAQAFGALGTIPASTWGVIACERVAAGTMTFVSAAANYTTGYASEALAIAALPAITANKVRVGYVTVLATSSTWVAGTDALTGGTGGTPATTTNYYNDPSIYAAGTLGTAAKIGDLSGTAITT